ncbi:MAG: tetratricopeptide repeat protein, partial [Deltaproteobacteria bacterium]|nr:tetratricopeptide repeat protein [Deltaproteobacteria bacterium]
MTGNSNRTETKKNLIFLSRAAHQMMKMGSYNEAEDKYLQVLKADPDNVYALVGMGDLKKKTRQFKEAVSYY